MKPHNLISDSHRNLFAIYKSRAFQAARAVMKKRITQQRMVWKQKQEPY